MKLFLKKFAYLIFMILALPFWAVFLFETVFIGREKPFYGFSQLLSLFPGIPGNYLRWGFYKLTLRSLGEDACICFGATIANSNVSIGRGVYIGPFCNLGLCTIEDNVLLGTDVHIMSGFAQHGYADLEVSIRDQKGALLNVRIGSNTWIGNKAVVGNHVGEQCIVGAASLVVQEIPSFSIAVGNPARVIRDRRNLQVHP
jgi:virginiamycin A acetyltransferase